MKRRFSSRARLLALTVVAVLLPTTILSVLQYRSLADLEGKTRAAVEENLRQAMHGVSGRVQADLEEAAREALDPIAPRFFAREYLPWLGDHFAAVRRSRAEIDQLFLFSYCPGRQGVENFAYFGSPEGVKRIEETEWKAKSGKANLDALLAISSYTKAQVLLTASRRTVLTPSPGMPRGFLYWQRACPDCKEEWPGDVAFIFRCLIDSGTRQEAGFVGMRLNGKYIREVYLPREVSGLLHNLELKTLSPDLVLGILDERRREIYASPPGARRFEIRVPFDPVFPQWELAAGFKSTTVAKLARSTFLKSLALTCFVFSVLLLGILLILRAAAREMRLAEAKSTFVSNVSHELKTPLALIRLFAETLELGRVKAGEKAQEYYHIIHQESQRLTQLINNILDFSKIEAGRKQYEFVSSDVAEVVRNVIRSYEYQIRNAGFELIARLDPGLPPARIDPDALSQAVLNLLNNAVKYSAEVKRIEVRVSARNDHLAIEVADQGIGIPRSEQEKIFEKFYRVSTGLVHATKGSGLGLALVKHIVEAHGGTISVESAPGQGSRFTILIPAQVSKAGEKLKDNEVGGYSLAQNSHH